MVKTGVYVISAGLRRRRRAAAGRHGSGAAEPAANTSFLLNSVAAVVLGGVSLFGGRATIFAPGDRRPAAHRAGQRPHPLGLLGVLPTT